MCGEELLEEMEFQVVLQGVADGPGSDLREPVPKLRQAAALGQEGRSQVLAAEEPWRVERLHHRGEGHFGVGLVRFEDPHRGPAGSCCSPCFIASCSGLCSPDSAIMELADFMERDYCISAAYPVTSQLMARMLSLVTAELSSPVPVSELSHHLVGVVGIIRIGVAVPAPA